MMEVAIGETHARDGAAEAAIVGPFQVETRLERDALDRGADVLPADLERVAGKPDVAHGTRARELHGAGSTEIVEDAACAAGTVEAGEREHLAGDEATCLVRIHTPSQGDGRRKRHDCRDSPQHNTRKHALLRTNPAAGDAFISLPAAYHTNHGDIEAAWLVKSERR